MKTIDFKQLIADCDQEIRSGQAAKAASKLARLNTNKIPREHRLAVANICRRLGLIAQGLKILTAVVRPRSGGDVRATPEENAEYAILLHRSGVEDEAIALLEQVDGLRVPQALLFRAFCLFSRWEYQAAVPLLQQYTGSSIQPYSRLVGEVNLAAALIGAGHLTTAEERVQNTLEGARQGDFKRLEGNCLELLAQIDLFQNRIEDCLQHLNEAETRLQNMPTIDHFFVFKWHAIATALRERDAAPLLQLKEAAGKRGDWETVREADRHRLSLEFSQNLFEHLIFGTPFAAYRTRLYSEFQRQPASDIFLYGAPTGPVLDLAGGHGPPGVELEKGGKCVEMLEVLTRDFYRPKVLGALFAGLYPTEHFDIYSSPTRIHQLVARTRAMLRENNLPLELESQPSGYSLKITGAVRFRLPLERRSLSGYPFDLDRLLKGVSNSKNFSAKEARAVLGMPRTTFQRFVNWAKDAHLIESSGQGVDTHYRLVA